tara:strand:+ start:772 stop:891 length:120 start_codon:yes stop_codon:yes gene_type:complete
MKEQIEWFKKVFAWVRGIYPTTKAIMKYYKKQKKKDKGS